MIILTIAVMVYYQDFIMKEKIEKAGAETSARRLAQEPPGGDEELTGVSILKDFASDFVDPKAVGYGFLL